MADIFISYTSSDRDWAFWIAHELEALGHIAHVHEWELPAGGNIMAWMEERHNQADHILCVVSKAYFEQTYLLLETTVTDTSLEVRTVCCEQLSEILWKHVGVRETLRSQVLEASLDGGRRQRLLRAIEHAERQVSRFWEERLSGARDDEEEPEMASGYPAFRVSQFRLRDIGPIRDTGVVRLDRGVNIFLGDNAAGKTTVLRSLGLAAVGQAAANEVEDNAAAYLRKGADRGAIEVLFELIPDPDALSAELGYFAVGLEIVAGSSRFSAIADSEMSLFRPGQAAKQLANSTERLRDGTAPAQCPNDNCDDEAPLLVDPTVESDVALITFTEGGRAVPAHPDEWQRLRAKTSIERYKLNDHPPLLRARAKVWNECRNDVNEIAKLMLDQSNKYSPTREQIIRTISKRLKQRTWSSSEFSAVARTALFQDPRDWARRLA